MSYIYALINQKNKKKFIGKTNLEEELLKKVLYHVLDDNNHYNDLLQKDWNKDNFSFETIEVEDCVKDFDKMIQDENLLNPIYGYNVFQDLQNKKGRHKKRGVFTEDICLLYCFHENIPFWCAYLELERNTVTNRLSNFDLFDSGYFSRSIARYEDYYWTALRILYLEEICLTAEQLMDKMFHRYKISGQLRVTPRRISKFFSANHIDRRDKKENGCLVFCPKCNKSDEDE